MIVNTYHSDTVNSFYTPPHLLYRECSTYSLLEHYHEINQNYHQTAKKNQPHQLGLFRHIVSSSVGGLFEMLQTIKLLTALSRDLLLTPKPAEILSGRKMLRPFLAHQNTWIQHFHPQTNIEPHEDSWRLLQQFMMPLIKQHGSSYHTIGIQKLGLDEDKMPEFESFRSRFRAHSNGFDLARVSDEIEPREYFSLILEKKFPCVQTLRPVNEIFCGNEPDFWHEAIGHIAPLCFPEIQQFYLDIAAYMLSAPSDLIFNHHLAVSWTLTEYAFIKENGHDKLFGAALIGSHLAHMRYLHGYLALEPANRQQIIDSGFFSENTPVPRDAAGKLRFFQLNDLDAHKLYAT